MTHPHPQPRRCVLTMHEVSSIKDLVFIVGGNAESTAQKAIFEILADGVREATSRAAHTPAAPAERLCDECNIIELEERLMNLEQELKDAYRNGFDEGFEIGKSQCETHHQEMKEQARNDERERVLDKKNISIIRNGCIHPYWEKCGGLNCCQYFVEKTGDCLFDVDAFVESLRGGGAEQGGGLR